jgi:GT2 family glycosyltransferase
MEVVGRVDGMQGTYAVGWAIADPDTKNCSITVTNSEGDVIANGRASRHRADLAALRLDRTNMLRSGRTNMAFSIALPGCSERSCVHVLADGIELPGSPLEVGPGQYDGHCKLDGRTLSGWVSERVPWSSEPAISVVDEQGEIVAQVQSALDRSEYAAQYRQAAFAVELADACFSAKGSRLDVRANGTKFAEILAVQRSTPAAPADKPKPSLSIVPAPMAAPEAFAGGFIDLYGRFSLASGWLFSGWVMQGWPEHEIPRQVVITFEQGTVRGEPIAVSHSRQDLPAGAEGVVFFLPGAASHLGALVSFSFMAGGTRISLLPAPTTQELRAEDLLPNLKQIVASAKLNQYRDRLLRLLARQPYRGTDTLETLGSPVSLYIDAAILCEPDGLALIGWCLCKPGDVREIRVRSGSRSSVLNLADAIKIERHDVLEAYVQHGFNNPMCGFVAFVPHAVEPGERIYIEVETSRDEIGYQSMEQPKLSGIAAIKRLLSVFDVQFADVQAAYDHVLGPAVEALNHSRLATRPNCKVIEYGSVPQAPKFSVIVALYGRLDFVEYQLALFSAHPQCAEIEFIYVLDDPAKQKQAQALFTSAYDRFVIPFRAVLLDRNLGFAPANNIGLGYAHGKYIAYLNSDVFPGSLDWLERLSQRLEFDTRLGVIGPLLLFEDGSVQHRGMFYKQLPEIGNWFFCQHQDKGLRYAGGEGVQFCLSITGACMVMKRDLAILLGGFDETYIIGDFEDSDLCFKLRELGYKCAVDTDVTLYHLERKSQASANLDWRMNLTVYNAWQHERRWTNLIAAEQAL